MPNYHAQLKVKLPEYLTMSNVKSIMTLLDWPPGKQDSVKDQTDLINKMETEEVFKVGRYEELIQILEMLRLIQAANLVREYAARVCSQSTTTKPVQESSNSWKSGSMLRGTLLEQDGMGHVPALVSSDHLSKKRKAIYRPDEASSRW